MELVTGYKGKPHVSAADDGCRNASFIGQGRYVSTMGEQFAATMKLASEITIASGDLFNQGRHMHIREGQYESLEVADLEAGYYRNDLVVCRYTMDADGIEDCELVVITGVRYASSASVQDPSYTVGNILAGATLDEFPLYRLKGTGGSIPVIEKLFEVVKPLSEIQNEVDENKKAITELNGKLPFRNFSDIGAVAAVKVLESVYVFIGEIPFLNADKYNIAINYISNVNSNNKGYFSGWNINKTPFGFNAYVSNNADAIYWVNTYLSEGLSSVHFSASLIE